MRKPRKPPQRPTPGGAAPSTEPPPEAARLFCAVSPTGLPEDAAFRLGDAPTLEFTCAVSKDGLGWRI